MKRLLLASLLLTTAAHAETYQSEQNEIIFGKRSVSEQGQLSQSNKEIKETSQPRRVQSTSYWEIPLVDNP